MRYEEHRPLIRSDYEWVSFFRNDPPEILLKKITDATNQVQGVARGGIDPVGAILGIGILALLLGIAFGGDR